MRTISGLQELAALAGQEVALSGWIDVPQTRIDSFANATDDHQWIHVDEARAAEESPFGGTVAHGFLTLSLLPAMLQNALKFENVKMVLNYGLNKVRFPAPLLAGSRVRGRLAVLSFSEVEGGVQVVWMVTMESADGGKPVCVAEFVMRGYP
jgi:acyl dehydratase